MNLQAQTLVDFKWENRLIVFNGEVSKENVEILEKYQNLSEELIERKIVILVASETGLIEVLPSSAKHNKKPNIFYNLQKRFPQIKVLLIGLDGSIKRKSNLLYEPKELFNIID